MHRAWMVAGLLGLSGLVTAGCGGNDGSLAACQFSPAARCGAPE
jgi:hypothetical protein